MRWLTAEPPSAGWIRFTFRAPEQELLVVGSYLIDSPRELLLAVRGLLKGMTATNAKIADEPGEYRVLFSVEDGVVEIRVEEIPKTFSTLRDGRGSTVFSTSLPLTRAARDVATAIRALSGNGNADSYLEGWRHPHPTTEVAEVFDLIRLNDSI